ncbi:MAG TPA: hypothetical protein VF043_15440 [Ktedonobacteraceae bacterium]
MHQPFSLPAGNRVNNRRQAYALPLLGVVFLFIAWVGILNPYALGVLLFGLGILGVAPLNPRRFLSAGWLTTSLGVATFLMFRKYIPDSQILTAHLLAIGLGLLGIAWMARRGYRSAGELTPGLFVVGVAVSEFLQAAHLTPSPLVPFVLSLWLPGSGLFVLGLVALVTSGRIFINAKRHQEGHTETHVYSGKAPLDPAKDYTRR